MTDVYDDYDKLEPAPAPPARRIRFDPTRRRGGGDAYAQARRHSRIVRGLKFILPVAAVLGVAGFFGIMHLRSGNNLAPAITLAGVDVDEKSLVMDKPHISGFEGTRHAYEVTADRAVQDIQNPKVVTFENIRATFGIADNMTAEVKAAVGVLNGDSKLLTLRGGIVMETNNGYRATFEEAEVDLGSGRLASTKPLEIVAREGRIKANTVVVRDRGKGVLFDNGVSVVLDGDDGGTRPSAGIEVPPGSMPAADRIPTIGGNS